MASDEQVAAAVAALLAADPCAWVSIDGLHRVHESGAARLLGVKPRTLRAWREMGTGPRFVRMPGRLTYRVGALLDWLASRDVDPLELDGGACRKLADRAMSSHAPEPADCCNGADENQPEAT